MPMASRRIWIFMRLTRSQWNLCRTIRCCLTPIRRAKIILQTRSILDTSLNTTRGLDRIACRRAYGITILRRADGGQLGPQYRDPGLILSALCDGLAKNQLVVAVFKCREWPN